MWIGFSRRIGLVACLAGVASGCATPAHYTSRPNPSQSFAEKLAERRYVDLNQFAPWIRTDLQYRYSYNVTGRPIYPSNMPCLIRKDTAEKLVKAEEILRAQGYGLKVWDAWRPPEAHTALWNAYPDDNYIAPPSKGWSLHCYGKAVDVTLVDSWGNDVEMPTGFDNFTPNAAMEYKGGNFLIKRRLQWLRYAMSQAGFRETDSEWWHYYDPDLVVARPVYAKELGIQLPIPPN